MHPAPRIVALVLAWTTPLFAIDLAHKTYSLSRQFVVYGGDLNARSRIASFADETKKNVLTLLGEPDHWKFPIVIKVEPESAANPGVAPSRVQLCETDEGEKIELDVLLGGDPHEIRFEQQVARAVLLELAYRDHPPAAGMSYPEPPDWLIEGVVASSHREEMATREVFKVLLNNDHLTRLADFLTQDQKELDAASRQLYRACALGLVQLLVELPGGRASLGELVRDLPRDDRAGSDSLVRHFPALAASGPSMEKWWSLSMARLATADRYEGLTVAETEQRLAPLLTFEIAVDKGGAVKKFTLDDFETFRKLPASRAALTQVGASLLALGTQASALFRPVISDYQAISAGLARGKTRGVKERLAAAAKYRELVLTRLDEIADYLNWFQATQEISRSDSFDDYFKTARSIARTAPKRDDAISRYLDAVQRQVE